jgi:hypothetical protein
MMRRESWEGPATDTLQALSTRAGGEVITEDY